MKLIIECADCETELPVYHKSDGDKLTMMVEPCPRCVARKIMLAEQPWMRKKLLKEGGMAA